MYTAEVVVLDFPYYCNGFVFVHVVDVPELLVCRGTFLRHSCLFGS